MHPAISERFALGAAPGAMEVPEEVQSAGGGELSPARSAGCGGHRALWQPGPPLHPACSGEKEELRLGLGLRSSGHGLGGPGWATGTRSRAGDSRNMRNTGEDSQPSAGGPFKQLQPLWMALGEGKSKPEGGGHCAL